jgi:hypothetical protein
VIYPKTQKRNIVLKNTLFALHRYQRLRKVEDSKEKFEPRIMLFNYTEDDWVFDFCNTVSTIINSDPITNKYLRYYNTTFDLKSDEKEQIIQAADLTPQILEG